MKKFIFFSAFLMLLVSRLSAQDNSYIGTWKLISQKIMFIDGRSSTSDSSNHIQIKIITPTHFMLLSEVMVNGANACSYGHYTLNGNKYVEHIEYASYEINSTLQTDFTLRREGDKLYQSGIMTNSDGSRVHYDEVYIKEK